MGGALNHGSGTLSGLRPGDSGRVGSILYGALRDLLGDLGVHEGETVRCRAGTGGVLVLEMQDGRTISLAREWCRFIRVEPIATLQDFAS